MHIFTLLLCALCGEGQAEYTYLDRIALETGTDKSSDGHNYTEVYAHHFAPLRHQPIKLLEIGIASGASVKLWERYFPNATLHFIDICPDVVQYYSPSSPRIQYHFLDQSNTEALRQFAADVGESFDIIIDDGGHHMNQQIISFQTLFPHLKSGGLYIIEDLHTSYWTSHGGNGTVSSPRAGQGTAVEFLKSLVEDLNYTGGITGYADWKKTPPEIFENLNDYQKNIAFVQFYKSLCVIKKR
ncbi:MAG: class I SAM-dependent methyltransferase [Thermodesulfobacteriota bacterium]